MIEPSTSVVIAASAIASYLIVAFVRTRGGQRLLDAPNSRSSHTRPTPRGGGIGIVMSVVAGALIVHGSELAPYLGLGLLIAVVSFLDDLSSLPAMLRFAVHGAAALGVILLAGYWTEVGLPAPESSIALGMFGTVITFLWIVGLTNAYNFMDGIDGLAGLQAIIASVGWAVIIGASAWSPWNTFVLLIAASSLGCLLHNWPPAAIFMGDVGSAFLGFSFAMIGVVEGKRQPVLVLSAVLLVWPFVFDATLTFIRRLTRREAVFKAHRTHLYQRLVITGLPHRTVTLIYGACATASAGCAVALSRGTRAAVVWVPLAIAAISGGLVIFTHLRERTASEHPARTSEI